MNLHNCSQCGGSNPAVEAYRVMRLVLPTLWSPSNTIFVRFGGEEEKSAETGVDGVSMGGTVNQDCERLY
jgi:hypothetical protein